MYEFNLEYDKTRVDQNFKDRHLIDVWCHEHIDRRESWWLVGVLKININDKSNAMRFMLVWY